MVRIGPRTKKVVQDTLKYGMPSTFAYPLTIKDARGSYVQDLDGQWFLDFNSQVCSCNIGYKHPEIVKVLQKYSKLGAHKIAGQDFFTNQPPRCRTCLQHGVHY